MDTVWYYRKQHGERFLKIQDIARVCDCSVETIERWFAGEIVEAAADSYVDAGRVIGFLVANDMPVDSLLYPPNTRKLLIISSNNHSCQYEERVNCVLNFFSSRSNLLIEKSGPGQLTDLGIVSLPPDIVVYFLGGDEQQSCRTLMLITSFPELFSLVVLHDREYASGELREILARAGLVVDDWVPIDEFHELLSSTFSAGGR